MSSVLSYKINIVTHTVYFLFRIYHPTICLVIILMLNPVYGQVTRPTHSSYACLNFISWNLPKVRSLFMVKILFLFEILKKKKIMLKTRHTHSSDFKSAKKVALNPRWIRTYLTDSDYPFGIFKLVLNTLSSFWSLFAYCCMLSGEKQIPNLYVFGLTRPVLESINYRTG
jgi:hypothetical protein